MSGGAFGSSSAGEVVREVATSNDAAPAQLQSAGLTSPPGAVHGAACALPERDGLSGTSAAGSMWHAFMDEVDELHCYATPGKQRRPDSLWQGTGAGAADEACFATSYD